jgi:hypothetical protein
MNQKMIFGRPPYWYKIKDGDLVISFYFVITLGMYSTKNKGKRYSKLIGEVWKY